MRCFTKEALKCKNPILLYIVLVDAQMNVHCWSVLKVGTGNKLLIDFIERWLTSLNEYHKLVHIGLRCIIQSINQAHFNGLFCNVILIGFVQVLCKSCMNQSNC